MQLNVDLGSEVSPNSNGVNLIISPDGQWVALLLCSDLSSQTVLQAQRCRRRVAQRPRATLSKGTMPSSNSLVRQGKPLPEVAEAMCAHICFLQKQD